MLIHRKKLDTRIQSDLLAVRNHGFSIVETMVAVAILAMTVVAPLTIASHGLNAAYLSKDRLTAAALAQDAIEYIRSVRDTNRLNRQPWLSGLDACRTDTNNPADIGCVVETTALDPSGRNVKRITGQSSAGPILFEIDTGLYGYRNTWQTTKFTRQLVLRETVAGREASISVTVSWLGDGGVSRSLVLYENISNW